MRKSSLNFTFGKDGSRKSDLIRPNSSKHVFLEISQDWRQSYLVTTLRDISAVVVTHIQGRTQELCYIYNKCFQKRVKVYLFVHLFIYLFIFYFLLLQRDIFLIWQSSCISFWTVTSLFSSMSRVAVWRLLKRITKHVSPLYLCILVKVFEKARESTET